MSLLRAPTSKFWNMPSTNKERKASANEEVVSDIIDVE